MTDIFEPRNDNDPRIPYPAGKSAWHVRRENRKSAASETGIITAGLFFAIVLGAAGVVNIAVAAPF